MLITAVSPKSNKSYRILKIYILNRTGTYVIYTNLARRGLPFFGNSFGDGMLPDLLHFIGKEYEPIIQKHLSFNKKINTW